MQRSRNLAIAAITVVVMIALVAVFGREQRAAREIGGASGAWLPDLQAALPELTQVRLQSGASVATLVRKDGAWGIAERAGYPIDFTRLGSLLRDLAEANRLEQKTSKPEHFARLGLDDIEKPGSKAVLVEIWQAGEAPRWRVMIGNAAEGRAGRYVRQADGGETWLIDRSPQALAEPTDWLERKLLDIDFARISRVERSLAKGGFVALRETREQVSLQAETLPAGRKPRYETVFDSTARGVLSAEVEDVRRASEAGFDAAGADLARNVLLAFDGLRLEVEALKAKDGNWIRLRAVAGEPVPAPVSAEVAPVDAAQDASAAQEPVSTAAKPDTAQSASVAADAASEAAPATEDPAKKLAEEAAGLNSRLDGWAFKVSDYVYGELSKGIEEYTEEDKPEPAEAAPGNDS